MVFAGDYVPGLGECGDDHHDALKATCGHQNSKCLQTWQAACLHESSFCLLNWSTGVMSLYRRCNPRRCHLCDPRRAPNCARSISVFCQQRERRIENAGACDASCGVKSRGSGARHDPFLCRRQAIVMLVVRHTCCGRGVTTLR